LLFTPEKRRASATMLPAIFSWLQVDYMLSENFVYSPKGGSRRRPKSSKTRAFELFKKSTNINSAISHGRNLTWLSPAAPWGDSPLQRGMNPRIVLIRIHWWLK
jgi:hypothetical protein